MTLADLFDAPLEYIVTEEGVVLERDGDRLVGLCPFHEDTDPSFALWHRNDREWVGCFACGFGPTDAIGFLRRKYHASYATALVLTRRYAHDVPEDWKSSALPMTHRDKGTKDFTNEALRAQSGNCQALLRFLTNRGFNEGQAYRCISRYRLGGDDKWIVVPHYTPDGLHVTGLKYREGAAELIAMKESTLSFLYGCWLDKRQDFVVIAEGESDAWRLDRYFDGDTRVLVLSVPHGACGPKVSWLPVLEGRKLLVMFDGDEAGRVSAAEWLKARPDAKIVDPGEAMDASKLSDGELGVLLRG